MWTLAGKTATSVAIEPPHAEGPRPRRQQGGAADDLGDSARVDELALRRAGTAA